VTDFDAIAKSLPLPSELRRRALVTCVLEVLGSPLSEFGRYSTFTAFPNGWQVFTESDGAGDNWSITFTPVGTLIRVFSHESEVSPFGATDEVGRRTVRLYPGLLEGIPHELMALVNDPHFDASFGEGGLEGVPLATYYFWRANNAAKWSHGTAEIDDRANEGAHVVSRLCGTTEEWHASLADGADEHDPAPSLETLEALLAGEPITQEVLDELTGTPWAGDSAEPLRTLAEALVETRLMGYGQTPYFDPRGDFDHRIDGYDVVPVVERVVKNLRASGLDEDSIAEFRRTHERVGAEVAAQRAELDDHEVPEDLRDAIDHAWGESRSALLARLEEARTDETSSGRDES
jgi:hypothetical protein